MKKSISKILPILCAALLIIADSVGKSSIISAISDRQGESFETTEIAEAAGIRLADEVQSVDHEIVRKYAEEYGADYRLILAMMKQESQFDEHAVSYRGARGLMQIMPVTNSELNEELELGEPTRSRENIQAGVYYFTKLYSLFKAESNENRIRMALAAYNAGPSRIYDAQELAAYLGENPNDWRSIRTVLPLLSKRYYSLHQAVWGESRPPAGYFGSSKETTLYVDAVMKTYGRYLAMK